MGKLFDAEEDYKNDLKWERKFNSMKEAVKKPTFKKRRVIQNPDEFEHTHNTYFLNYINDAFDEIKKGNGYYAYNSDIVYELVKIFGEYVQCRKYDFYYFLYIKQEDLLKVNEKIKIANSKGRKAA